MNKRNNEKQENFALFYETYNFLFNVIICEILDATNLEWPELKTDFEKNFADDRWQILRSLYAPYQALHS